MDLIDRVISQLEERRDNILNGNINSIPSPFQRFREDFIGIEQSQYVTITSSTKGSKTQYASFMYVFTPILYSYYHPEKASVKIIYFPLEETSERITQRFMSYLLYTLSKGKIRISPTDLRSTDNDKVLSQDIIDILKSEEYQKILKFFEESIIFDTTNTNPTGVYKSCRDYALSCGKVVNKIVKYGETKHEVFDYYTPNDPKHYKIVFLDHIGLLDCERGLNLKQSIDKMSEYLAKYLRNRYGFTCVVIQQQAFSGEDLEAQKFGKPQPTIASLGDSRYTSRDSDLVLGLFSPFKFGIDSYLGYDIRRFKDNIRFLSVLVNRNGNMGGVCPLYFDGAVSYFAELPRSDDKEGMEKIYAYINKQKSNKLFLIKRLTKWLNL